MIYTRRDTVAIGYAIHLGNFCVDANLLATYRAQNSPEGWRATQQLPAIRSGQAIGTSLGQPLLLAIRDNGMFLDPRSRKDWWQR